MDYTVAQLAKISGVSVRTLHWYDEMGLLKPAYYGSNGYRYYEEEQLLALQQILFFRELGFELKRIGKILGRSGFDQRVALSSHRKVLQKELERIRQLIKTIDHLEEKKKMSSKEFFNGFDLVVKAKGGESYFAAEEVVLKSAKVQTLSEAERQKIKDEAIDLLQEIALRMKSGSKPTSKEVEELIQAHYRFTERCHLVNQEVYRALAQLYREHPVFRKQLELVDPQLPDFLSAAMDRFALKTL